MFWINRFLLFFSTKFQPRQWLVISASMNVVLFTMVVLGFMRPHSSSEKPGVPKASHHITYENNEETVDYFRGLPIKELLSELQNDQEVQEGVTVQQLALATLVTFHHFDLPRALLGLPQPTQQQTLLLKDGTEVTLYPAISEEHYQALNQFGQKEKWPLTSYGLFTQLQQQKGHYDPSLMEAFFLTPEFLSVETLFNRSGPLVDKSELLNMLCQGQWSQLAQFARKQRRTQDFSASRRQRLLIDYIAAGSPTAACLMLKTDESFAAEKMDDVVVATLLQLLDNPTAQAEVFAKAMLISDRSDAVKRAAAGCLYQYVGEKPPVPFDSQKAVQRFISGAPAPKSQEHVVQDGETLWRISRKYRVDVEKIKTANNLQNDVVRTGKKLIIPASG